MHLKVLQNNEPHPRSHFNVTKLKIVGLYHTFPNRVAENYKLNDNSKSYR